MNIICFRHGESVGNKKDITQGHMDYKLTKKGKKQAKELNRSLNNREITVDKIYSSDLTRALETAKIAFPEEDIIKDNRLREQNYGEIEGGKLDDFIANNPEYSRDNREAFELNVPDGECIKDVENRVKSAFYDFVESHNDTDTICISCHYTPMMVLLSIAKDHDLYDIWFSESIDNCEVLHLEYSESTRIIDRYNS